MATKIKYPCKKCGKQLEAFPSQLRDNRVKVYCNSSCRYADIFISKTCQHCRVKFNVMRCRNHKKYCSFKCATNGLKEFWKSPEERLRRSVRQLNDKNSNWKNGIRKVEGYIFLHHPKPHIRKLNGGVPRSVLVIEKHIGRKLNKKEVVHHINRVRTDDRIENLMLFKDNSEHMRHHCNERWGNNVRP